MSADYPAPRWRITIDGKDRTAVLDPLLIDLTLTDNRGLEADQLDIDLDDTKGTIAIPPRGASIRLWLGLGSGLIDKGRYTVDELEHDGPPDRLTVRARSANLRTGLTTPRERSFHALSIADIVRTIATGNGIKATVSDSLSGLIVDHIDQTNESDANLLSRLAQQYDAIATVKADTLLFMPAGGGVSAGGKTLPSVNIVRAKGDTHRLRIADRDNCTAVSAQWHDIDAGQQGTETWTAAKEAAATSGNKSAAPAVAIESGPDQTRTLPHVYASAANAQQAARSAWRKRQRGMAEFSVTLASGRPDLFPELRAELSGWKREIDETEWLIARVIHRLGDRGLTTKLEFEVKATGVA